MTRVAMSAVLFIDYEIEAADFELDLLFTEAEVKQDLEQLIRSEVIPADALPGSVTKANVSILVGETDGVTVSATEGSDTSITPTDP
jgi:hypothetical protein